MKLVVGIEEGKIEWLPYKKEVCRNNHGCFDLKIWPERIDQIPELAGEPCLKELVRNLNARNSLFRTIGCDYKEGDELPNGQSGHFVYAALYVVFEQLELNGGNEKYVLLGNQLKARVESLSKYRGKLTLKIGRAKFIGWDYDGWFASFHVRGIGENRHKARESWEAGLNYLSDFFLTQPRLSSESLASPDAKMVTPWNDENLVADLRNDGPEQIGFA